MPRFAEVRHSEWIAAAPTVVRAQFADLDHHIAAGVHPKLRFTVLARRPPGGARFEQRVRLLGVPMRDVFERSVDPEGGIVDTAVAGFNRGGSVVFAFAAEPRDGRDGTRVDIRVRLPLPPLVGALLRPLLEAQVRREVRAAALEDKFDIEQRGYPAARSATGLRLAA